VIHARKNTYYRDVHVFVERIKKMTIVLDAETVRRNLSSCLRETTLIWHIAELFDVSRRILFYEENMNEWVQILTARFKTQVTTTTTNLLKERYILTNAERNRESREYAQKIIRWIKFAEMSSSFNQLNIVYNEIDSELRRDLKKSSKNTSINDYLQLLNDYKNIWWSLTRRNQEYAEYFTNSSNAANKSFQYNSNFRFYDNRSAFFNQQRYNNWNEQKNQKNQSHSQLNNWRSYQNDHAQYRNFQRQFNRNSQRSYYQQQLFSQQSSRTQQINNDPRYSSKVIMSPPNSENAQTKSQQSWQNKQFQKSRINYQNKPQKAHFDDYDSQYDENDIFENENSATHYNDDDYYENRSYDEILKISAESEDLQSAKSNQEISEINFEEILDEELIEMIKSSQLALKCRQCEMKFYSNNKLHKHIRSNQHVSRREITSISGNEESFAEISIVISTREQKDHKDFAFRDHQFARVKRTFDSKDNAHELCADFETFMFLIDRKFLQKNASISDIKRIEFNLKVREIEFKTHDTFEYCSLNLFFRKKFKKESRIAHIQREFHLIDDLDVNVLIEIDIMRSEKCILNFKIKIMTFFFCAKIEMLIIIVRTSQFVNRSMLVVEKIVISSHTDMTVFVKIREKSLSERDYIFNSKEKTLLDSEERFFNHIFTSNSIVVQMRNTFDRSFVILKNYKIEKLIDYHENECFLISSNDRHLVIALNRLFRQEINPRKIQDAEKLETILLNEIIVHENEEIVRRIANVIDRYLDVWKDESETINISEKRWMKIKTILETNSEANRIYKLKIENQAIIDKEFDALHALKKMKWAFESISYAYSVFVIWTITHLMRKPLTRRDRIMIDIRDLNKISEHDAYSMSLQSDILSKTQECSYIFVMNCITFFYQWRVVIFDRHKLIVVTHRDAKQWNVDVMKHRNTNAYVQREMNNILREYSWVKTYIDDVIVFSKFLEKHLDHLSQLFALFQELNITLKAKKTYLEYLSISLLRQKIDSLDLITAENKLKAIVKLSFLKTLKDLKKYLEMIEWLRDYVVYYAQKAESLQKRKTNLLKEDSVKRKSRKSFNLKTLVKNSSSTEINVYNQLQSDFSRARWLTHYHKMRQLYADVNVSRKRIEVMIYHLKKETDKFKNSSFKRDVESILFLSKILFKTEFRYWSTELKMIELIWIVKKIAHMIKSSKHSIVIYIDHEIISVITAIIKLITSSTDRLNMKLIRVFMYLSQFRLNIRHRSEKSNVISDALSKLSVKRNNSSHEALNLNQDLEHYQSDIETSESDQVYVYVTTLVKMFTKFRTKIQKEYQKKTKWMKLIKMLKNLNKRRERDNHEEFELDFMLKDELLFHVKNKKRLCILTNCEIDLFRIAHDENNHVEHNRVYTKLVDQIYISRLSRKIRQYVKHCSICELSQTKRHSSYEELVSIFAQKISFRTLAMNFISALSEDMNTTLIVTCKISKRVTIILDKFTWIASNWAETLLDRLLIANWSISEEIISNRDSKFISDFWKILFSKLDIKLLMFTAYHSQIDEQSKRTNQIVEIALRFFLTEISNANWISAISLIQASLNNSLNAAIELSSNEITYEFKIRDILFFLITEIIENTPRFKILKLLNQTRLRNRQEATNVVSFANVKVKIIHDKRHRSLFLNSKKKVFLRLHKEYNLSEIINKKLSQQKCDSFTVKRRVERLTYELELSKTWRIHLVIFVTQLESASDDSYKRSKSNYSDFIFVESDTETFKFYEIERVLAKRIRQYEKIKINQYLIRWKDYESEFDEWKSISNLKNCMSLVEYFEQKKRIRTQTTRSQKETRSRRNRVNVSRHQ
jgi:hypothetical protein